MYDDGLSLETKIIANGYVLTSFRHPTNSLSRKKTGQYSYHGNFAVFAAPAVFAKAGASTQMGFP